MKTPEFGWLKQEGNIAGQEIISFAYKQIDRLQHLLDPYITTQFKKCGTLNRVTEIYFADYLLSLGLDVKRHAIFDFLIDLPNEASLIIEVTTPAIVIVGKNDLEKINSVTERIIKSLDDKLKDYRKNKGKICSEMGFVIALSCAKLRNTLLIPDQYKPVICNKMKEHIKNHPEISGVILSWCWYYYFPEVTAKHYGASFKDVNDIVLVKNESANITMPESLSFGAQIIM